MLIHFHITPFLSLTLTQATQARPLNEEELVNLIAELNTKLHFLHVKWEEREKAIYEAAEGMEKEWDAREGRSGRNAGR